MSLTAFTTMCPEEQQASDNLIVKDNCFINEIFDKGDSEFHVKNRNSSIVCFI